MNGPSRVSRYTYRAHVLGDLTNHIFTGILLLSKVVARRGLDASDTEIVILVSAFPASHILAFFWGYVMEGRNKRPFILWAGLLFRGALLFTALTTDSLPFVILCSAAWLSDPVFIPALNSIYQANYDAEWRGRLIGRVTRWTRIGVILASLGAGYALNVRPDWYRVLFPVAAVVGILSYANYARLRIRYRPGAEAVRPRPLRSFWGALKHFRRILREHPDFDRYERNFMIYGIAFMILLPNVVFLTVDVLGMDYLQISLAEIVTMNAAVALCAPLAGGLFDRWGAVRTAAVSFAILALFPATLLAGYLLESIPLVFVAFALNGVAMAGVFGTWQLGSMTFAGSKDASVFMGVHVTAVGVRGLLVPMIGYRITELFGLGVSLALAALLFLLASGLMARLDRKMKHRALAQGMPAG